MILLVQLKVFNVKGFANDEGHRVPSRVASQSSKIPNNTFHSMLSTLTHSADSNFSNGPENSMGEMTARDGGLNHTLNYIVIRYDFVLNIL